MSDYEYENEDNWGNDDDKEEIRKLIAIMHEYADKDFPDRNVPCSDVLLKKTNPYVALVFGKLWLFSRGVDKFTQQKRGYCYASIPVIAKQLGISENTVRDALKTLMGEDYIGSGKKKHKNMHFTKRTRLIKDVTPSWFVSKHQVRYYGILYKNFEKYIDEFGYKSEDRNEMDVDLESEIYKSMMEEFD